MVVLSLTSTPRNQSTCLLSLQSQTLTMYKSVRVLFVTLCSSSSSLVRWKERLATYLVSWIVNYYWLLLYSAILRSWADSLRSHVILHEWIAFYSAFLNIHRSGVLTALAWLVPQESAARESQSRRVLCTSYNHAPCHFMQIHIRKV